MMKLNVGSFYTKLYDITDHTPCKVDTPPRLGAYIIDWVVGGIFTGLPAVFIYSGIAKKTDFFSDLYVFESLGMESYWGFLTGFLCLLFALFYYVFVPLKIYRGQTFGKRMAGFKIVKTNGDEVDLKSLLIRQILGIFILESAAFIISNYLRQLTTLSLHFYVDYVWSLAGMIITLLSFILVLRTDSHRAIHDYLANTCVVPLHKEDEETKPNKQATTKANTVKNSQKKKRK